jgi:membrane-associated phospholipid phosphatase
VRRLFVLKAVGITACIWLFFIGYFQLLRHPVHPVTVVPLTALDHLIPFMPQALVPYVSLWVYVGIAPGLQLGFVELLVYGLWACALCLCGLGLFWLWPTQVPPATFDPSGFPGFNFMRGVDAAGNACPSMHVAIAIFTAIWIEFLLRKIGAPPWIRIVNAVWFAAIVCSTLALKQHVVIDVVAGAALGGVFAMASLRWRPR